MPTAKKTKAAPAAPKKKNTPAKSAKKTAVKPAAPKAAPKAPHPYDEKKPDAPAGSVTAFARALASNVRADAEQLAIAKVSVADAEQLESLANRLETNQEAWSILRDETGTGAVAETREPLRKGRGKLYVALRTFADEDARTQSALDDIGDATSDDDLSEDTIRLLALAKKHSAELKGTDITKAWLKDLDGALSSFKAARGGARPKSGDAATAQQESEATRRARRARNRAFWELGDCIRRVCRRAQYAFLSDPEKRASYTLYHNRSSSDARVKATPAATPEALTKGAPT